MGDNVEGDIYYGVPKYKDAIAARPSVFVCPTDLAPPCCEMDGAVVVGKSHYLPLGGCAATGNYAGVMASMEGPPLNDFTVKMGSGTFYLRKVSLREITDGLSTTLFVGEAIVSDTKSGGACLEFGVSIQHTAYGAENPINTPTGYPVTTTAGDRPPMNRAFQSRHPGGAQFVFGDATTSAFLSENIDQLIYAALATRNGSEVASQW